MRFVGVSYSLWPQGSTDATIQVMFARAGLFHQGLGLPFDMMLQEQAKQLSAIL